jgi:hypothetical protein
LKSCSVGNNYNIQYGIATNADRIFIGKAYLDSKENKPLMDLTTAPELVYFNGFPIESSILKSCIKSSTYNGKMDNTYAIFPYTYKDNKCIPISEKELISLYPQTYTYLFKHRKVLNNRNTTEKWYLYGRTQGLINMNKPKLVFKHIMPRNNTNIDVFRIPANVVVYSGLFITGNENELNQIADIVSTPDFKQYCCTIGKPMANDYVSINGKNIKAYLK